MSQIPKHEYTPRKDGKCKMVIGVNGGYEHCHRSKDAVCHVTPPNNDVNHIVNPTIRTSYCGIENLGQEYDERLPMCDPCSRSFLIEQIG